MSQLIFDMMVAKFLSSFSLCKRASIAIICLYNYVLLQLVGSELGLWRILVAFELV